MYYPDFGMVYIKDPLLLIGKSSPISGGSGFPLLLSEWSYARRYITVNKMKHFFTPIRISVLEI